MAIRAARQLAAALHNRTPLPPTTTTVAPTETARTATQQPTQAGPTGRRQAPTCRPPQRLSSPAGQRRPPTPVGGAATRPPTASQPLSPRAPVTTPHRHRSPARYRQSPTPTRQPRPLLPFRAALPMPPSQSPSLAPPTIYNLFSSAPTTAPNEVRAHPSRRQHDPALSLAPPLLAPASTGLPSFPRPPRSRRSAASCPASADHAAGENASSNLLHIRRLASPLSENDNLNFRNRPPPFRSVPRHASLTACQRPRLRLRPRPRPRPSTLLASSSA